MPPFGSITQRLTNPAARDGARPAMIADSTDPLPAPVAPTHRVWEPTSLSR